MASLDAFFIFSKFWFSRLSVLGVKRQKMVENDKKFCLTLYLRNCTSCDCGFCYTCVKWYLQQFFFHFFKILIFRVFQSSSINAKSKFWCVPHLLHMCVIFTDYALLTFCKIKLVKYWLKVLFFHWKTYFCPCSSPLGIWYTSGDTVQNFIRSNLRIYI